MNAFASFTSVDFLKIILGAIAGTLLTLWLQHIYKARKRKASAIRLTELVRTETENNRRLATKALERLRDDLAAVAAALTATQSSEEIPDLPARLFDLQVPLLAFRSAAWLAASRSSALDASEPAAAYAVEAPYSVIRQLSTLNTSILNSPSMITLFALQNAVDAQALGPPKLADCLRQAKLLLASQEAILDQLVGASEHSLKASKDILFSLEASAKTKPSPQEDAKR